LKAVVCKAYGPPENLVIEDMDAPEAGEGEVLIDIEAAGVNFPDALVIQDKYQYRREPPFVPGGEVAGRIRAIGPGVSELKPGDRVSAGGCRPGGFAEMGVCAAGGVRRLPDGMDPATGASLFTAHGTALYALEDRAALRPGETLLVLGAAGGVGLAAVELGKTLGARVIAAASTQEKLELCRSRGADSTIDYTREDLKQRVRELTGGAGADVVYDPVGGPYSEPALRATAWQGRFLVIGFAAGEIPRIPLNLSLLKGCQIVGVFFGAAMSRDPDLAPRLMQRLLALWHDGKLRVHVSRTYPLDQTAQALRDMLERRVEGKVVVVTSLAGA
jgi:NADPH2:quinone reductase